MATYDGIAAVSKAIIGLLYAARASFPHGPQPNLKLFHASDYDNPKRAGSGIVFPGITLYLYRVALNTSMRNASRQVRSDGKSYRAPLPLDLYYLLTAWADDVEMQQRLLGWSMRVLHDTPILPAALLNDHSPDVVDGVFREGETVELTLETLNFQDITTIWDKLKPKMQTSSTYIARMVMIESSSPIVEDMELAQTRIVDFHARNGSAT
jgi:hypothetical protein